VTTPTEPDDIYPANAYPGTIRLMITSALSAYADELRKKARSRRYAGPHNADTREIKRGTARDCDRLAVLVHNCNAAALAMVIAEALP